MPRKKSVPSVIPEEFLQRDIQVGDWVHLKQFDIFAKVQGIVPRVMDRRTTRLLEVEQKNFNPRKHVAYSPLLVFTGHNWISAGNTGHNPGSYDAQHATKVTKAYVHQYIGELVEGRMQLLKQMFRP